MLQAFSILHVAPPARISGNAERPRRLSLATNASGDPEVRSTRWRDVPVSSMLRARIFPAPVHVDCPHPMRYNADAAVKGL